MEDPSTLTCVSVIPKLGEKYLKVEILDATGLTVAGYIGQGDTDGDGVGNLYGDFCGAHAAPIAMQAAAPVGVSFYPGACEDGTPSTPTTGTVKVTFYKKV